MPIWREALVAQVLKKVVALWQLAEAGPSIFGCHERVLPKGASQVWRHVQSQGSSESGSDCASENAGCLGDPGSYGARGIHTFQGQCDSLSGSTAGG